jgi:Ca2+-binding RTX toxin-like protein
LGGGDDRATLGGGNDTVVGGAGSDSIEGGRGHDVLFAGLIGEATSNKQSNDYLYGDSSATISTAAYAGNDTLRGASGSANYINNLYGDAAVISSGGKGGDDRLEGGNLARNFLYGDAGTMIGNVMGGNDTLTGGSGGTNEMYGDASGISAGGDTAQGGADVLTGGDGSTNDMYGDAFGLSASKETSPSPFSLIGVASGGDDTLTGGNGTGTVNRIYGDTFQLSASGGATVTGGNDILVGGISAANTLYGDARTLSATAGSVVRGGDDILTAGDAGTNTLYGDTASVIGSVSFGNDTLISGTGSDTMWGDAPGAASGGADVFVFTVGSGNDFIMDFRYGEDLLDLRDYGITDADRAASLIQDPSSQTFYLSGGGSITLQNYTGPLDPSIFKFS